MWNEKDDTDKRVSFSEYLLSYLLDTGKQITLTALAEFQVIFKYFLNWKAAGCDSVYNFFG